MNNKLQGNQIFGRFGLIAKGVVYVLSGVLSFMAAFKLGNLHASDGSNAGIFTFIHEKPFGKIMLALIALGLICYTIWRLIQAIRDTEDKGSNAGGLAKRAAYFLSGVAYAGIAVVAIKFLLTGQKGEGDKQKELAGELLSKPFGQWMVGLISLILFALGAWQAYLAISGKYKKHVKNINLSANVRKWIMRAGSVGYISRGIVWMIIGWLFLKAAWNRNATHAGGTQNAFQWLQDSSYGTYLLAAVAGGLFCYGLFMFVRARYQPIHTGVYEHQW